jgi:fibronectin type 3 domain-containing protein
VIGFIPVAVDLTPYIKADGATDNVLAVDVARSASWFESPGFSQVFRFGQAMGGLFRNVYMYVTNPVHIPVNVYSNQKTWGTYIGTDSIVPATSGTATAASAVVEVQTNILNESGTAQTVTLTTQIVDANGNVVVTAPPITQSIPAMTPATFPSTPTPMFDQKITVPNPTLWYPNNSIYGKPYMYKVYHIVSVNGVVVDATQSPLGIRTITWDANYPYFNGHAMNLWGGSGRYDYPGLGSSVPDEQKWRDLQLFAAAGGNIWRPGHSSESEEFVEAADEYGVMVDQPSGDGEGHFNTPPADDVTLKYELHRDMIIRDRNHPSILDWESNNGTMNETIGAALIQIDQTWDSINPRVAADRTPDPKNGTMLGCTLEGCEVGVKNQYPNNPAWGSEYWGTGSSRGMAYDYELEFVAHFIDNWRKGVADKAFGMAQWYFADTPGESQTAYWESNGDLKGPGNVSDIRSIGCSMVDQNRFPKLLYYVYQADWTPYSIKPVVHLAHHWNRAYEYSAGTPIQENAFSNCPSVRLLINGAAKDPVTGAALADQVPNPLDSASTNLGQNTTTLPGQVYWNVNWAAGTVTAECLDGSGTVVATDSRTTAGPENKIVLTAVPELVKPDGTSFQWTANGSDAAFVVAEVEDANGNIVPTANDNVTFSVSGPAIYMGGTQQYVYDTGDDWTTYYVDAYSSPLSTIIGGEPYVFFHSPGDPELNFEGGLQKIALRSTFTPGTVTVTASAPGLASGSVTLTSVPLPTPTQSQAPSIVVPPANVATSVGYTATFTVSATGGGTLTYQWYMNGNAIAGATSSTYTTPATTLANNGESFTVTVTNAYGSVTSAPATLTVDADAAIVITQQPAAATVVSGQTATLTVVATGSPTITYQWYLVGTGAIAGANQSSYTPPTFTTVGTYSFYVVVKNTINSVTSSNATITVNAPTHVSIVTQPVGGSVPANQPYTLTAVVAGSAPYSYQWNFTPTGGTATVLTSSTTSSTTISYTISSFTSSNAGAYTVTVNNAANAPVTSAAATLLLAPPGVNLALNKTATSSSVQSASLGPQYAVDGSLTTRWASASAGAPPTPPVTGVDPSWLEVDLGSVQAFNTVYIYWENAYATNYQIQYSTDNATWNTALTVTGNTGQGGNGIADIRNFPTVQGRYIRMYGTLRATQYGYSIWEFEVYNLPQCGGATERYTIISAAGSLPTLVHDNINNLTWTQTPETFTTPGSQFTELSAATYCSSLNMSVPTASQAFGISGTSYASCAFPSAWSTWTTTVDPNNSADNAYVSYNSVQSQTTSWSYQVADNFPGESLCASSTTSSCTTVPSAPTGLTATAPSSSAISLTWTAVTPPANCTISSYSVYRSTTSGFTPGSGNLIASGVTSPSYTNTGLTASTTYYYVVEAVDADGTSAASAQATATTPVAPVCSAVPSAPTGLTATGISGSSIGLSWTAVTPPANCTISSYTVYGGTTANPTTVIASGVTGTTYTNTGLAAHTTYYYTVAAVDADGTSPVSAQESATTPGLTCSAVPSAPTGLTATASSSSTIGLSWSAVTPPANCTISSYTVYGGTTANPTTVIASGVTGTTYTNSGLASATTYYYVVKALDSDGTSAASAQAQATTPPISSVDFIAINFEGPAVNNSGGGDASFNADEDFTGGGKATPTTHSITTTAAGANAAPMAVYQTQRDGTFTYTIPGMVANSQHTVLLHFAEIYFTAAGKREFNVAINGTPVLTNFDVYAAAGGEYIAVVKSFTTSANSSGQIVVAFTDGADNQPSAAGLEIR